MAKVECGGNRAERVCFVVASVRDGMVTKC